MKNKILSVLFCLFISGFLVANIIVKDKDISVSERRKLSKLPEVTWGNIINGEVTDNFESYALDHFVLRDEFRTIKANVEFNVMGKLDSNDLYYKDGYIFKIEYPLKENKVMMFTDKMNKLYDMYFKGLNVYYSIIPDKNYYTKDNYLKMDYGKLIDIVKNNMKDEMHYIDITNSLDLEDYYYTDIHWKQEKIGDVVKTLARDMNFDVSDNYQEKSYEPFYGSYYGHMGLKVKTDVITYLQNDVTNRAIVNDYESNLDKVYEIDSLGKMDSYDVYLGGATALIEVENTLATTDKELIVFRDSFGSSLGPLLLNGYKKITFIDLRYMSSSLIKDYVKFDNQDILIIYNTSIINNSDLIK